MWLQVAFLLSHGQVTFTRLQFEIMVAAFQTAFWQKNKNLHCNIANDAQ